VLDTLLVENLINILLKPLPGGGGGATRTLPKDGGTKELHGDLTVGQA